MPTFSIVARAPTTGELGICVVTGAPSVRDRVPFIAAGVGAIATQGFTNELYGVEGLALLRKGAPPQDVLTQLLSRDPDRELRQVTIVDGKGETTAFTGSKTLGWRGHKIGDQYVVAGNLLVSKAVLDSTTRAFEDSTGSLAVRLLHAIQAGEEAGGDRRGILSAALVVAGEDGQAIDLRSDRSSNPIRDIEALLKRHS